MQHMSKKPAGLEAQLAQDKSGVLLRALQGRLLRNRNRLSEQRLDKAGVASVRAYDAAGQLLSEIWRSTQRSKHHG